MYNQYYNPWAGQPGNNFNLAVLPQKQQVIRVNGKNGAQAFQLAPDSSVLLLDTTAPLIWLVQTDGAGYKTSTPYSITPYKPQPAVEVTKVSELETRINRIEEELKEYHDKSNNANTVKYTIAKPSK